MSKWTREIAIRVSPGGKDHPDLSEYLARARKVAGTLAEQSDLAGRTFGSRYEAIAEDASVQATYNNAIKNGVPQVSATVNLTPPKKPPAQPSPPTPETELPETPTISSFKGAITFFVGDETQPVYHPRSGDFTPTATYIADEAEFRETVGDLIDNKEAFVGVINVKAVRHPNLDVRPIPPYVQEYVAERQSATEVAVNDYIAAIDQALASFPPSILQRNELDRVYFILDNSGSMRLTSVPEEVKEYLRSRGLSQITVESTPTERWIKFILDYFKSIS